MHRAATASDTPTRAARTWLAALAALVAIRLAVPLVALAGHGHKLPALPRWDYVAQTGDATGFYAAAREFIAAWGRLPHALVAVLALAALGVAGALALQWRRQPERRPWLLVGGAAAAALLACAGIAKMHAPGAAVIGWSLLWSLPLLPARAVGQLDRDVAFGLGLALSLAANAVTVVATAIAGARLTRSRALGLLAAALVVAWPLLSEPIAGGGAWANGQWAVDVGLHLYTEPLSTALVAVAFALLLADRLGPLALAAAGVALGYATTVKLSNGLLAAVALALVARRLGARRSLPFLLGALAFMPVVAVYWHLGYVQVFDNPQSWPTRPFSPRNVVPAWRDSLIFHPHTLAIVVPLAAVGAWALRRRPWALAAAGAWLLVNPVFYSFFRNLPQHPRFLYASLPALWVLTAAGAAWIARSGLRAWRLRTGLRVAAR
jgi:hypothetical protein